jgi:hypothetical protein
MNAEQLKSNGFELWETGGHCQAYGCVIDDDRIVFVCDQTGTGVNELSENNFIVELQDKDGNSIQTYVPQNCKTIDHALTLLGIKALEY